MLNADYVSDYLEVLHKKIISGNVMQISKFWGVKIVPDQ